MKGDVYKIEAVVTDELDEKLERAKLIDYVLKALEDLGFVIKTLDIRTHQL